MITKKEAKNRVLSNVTYVILSNSINAEIMTAVWERKFHCDWYSPVTMNLTESDIKDIEDYVQYLEHYLEYKVTVQKFLPNENFPNTRIKLHINWE